MILVTGGTGLLGSHLLFELSDGNNNIRALYRDEKKIKQVETLFQYYAPDGNHFFNQIQWVRGDVLDMVSLEDAFQGVETVYHCAALVSFAKKDFKKLIQVNRIGTANMVNFSLKHGVKRFAYVSSTAAIGGVANQLVDENTKWQISERTSGYSISKRNAEREVWRASEEGLDVIIINPSVIFAAGDLDEGSLTIFKTVKNGLLFYAPGSNAFVDARDVASCLRKLCESDIKNERFLCAPNNLHFQDSINVIASAFGVKKPRFCPPKFLALFVARLNEFLARIRLKKASITLESARAAYCSMRYSSEKLKQTLNHSFYSYENTVKNVVAYDKIRRSL